jgi:DNA-binding LacI/PurR family transcriptional regulator
LVASKVRDRVLRAVRSLGYQPNRLAQGLRNGHRKVVGVIIPDLQNPFFTGLVHGVETVLYAAGYTLLLGHSDGLAEREQTQLGLLRGEGVAGLVFIPGNDPGANYEAIRTWQIATVAIDRSPCGLEVDFVCTNNREGMRQAVSHLISLGYKEIAMLNGPTGLSVTQQRLAGYQDAFRDAGIALRESLVIHSDFRQEGGQVAMTRLLDMAKPPRAVVVANNLMTLGALQVIHERGFRIPDDVAVVGFDDMPWATSLRPPLTAVAQPAEELGQTAAQLLLERIENPQRPVRQVVIANRLMIRASCGARTSLRTPPPTVLEARRTNESSRRANPELKGKTSSS